MKFFLAFQALLALCLGMFALPSEAQGARKLHEADSVVYYVNKEYSGAAQCERKAYYSLGVIGLYYYGDSIVGYLWSSTSRYAPSRGKYPGFFVTRLKNVCFKKGFISFDVDLGGDTFLSNFVDLSTLSSQDALSKGYHVWAENADFRQNHVMSFSCRGVLAGVVEDIRPKVLYIFRVTGPYTDIDSFSYHDTPLHYVRMSLQELERLRLKEFCLKSSEEKRNRARSEEIY